MDSPTSCLVQFLACTRNYSVIITSNSHVHLAPSPTSKNIGSSPTLVGCYIAVDCIDTKTPVNQARFYGGGGLNGL